ncbi:MAG: tRNA lysidine(34) synthetase TilS [Clostridia bacterium]|nr:tRNA lysidine(34) synthetase TilS [Clostridia bacterium]
MSAALSLRDPRRLAELPEDAPLCVALSGGADSVALLCLLADDPRLSAVHVHHGIRGAEADRDADFCRALCAARGIPLTVLYIDAPALASKRGIGLESAARDGRYEAITAHLKEHRIPLLVTAHHADDQLETLLLHLLRGSGLNGLGGIPACRPLSEGILVARPLLSLTHRQLTAYLNEIGQSYVEDSTNGEPCCARNRLRLEVAPLLESLYPDCARVVSRAAESLREDEAYLKAQAADFLAREGKSPSLAALAALPRPIFARVMQQLLPEVPEHVHIDSLFSFCQKGVPHASLSLPGARVGAENGRLCLLPKQAEPSDYELALLPGENSLPFGNLAYLLPIGSEPPLSSRAHHKFVVQIPLCSAKIDGRLRVRNLRPGDRLQSCGVNRAVRRLPGPEVPLSTRATMPLLADDSGLLACPFGKNRNIRDSSYSKEGHDISIFLLFD